MKTWKTVSGVISILISAFVVFQSFFAGLLNILSSNGQSSGTAGLIVAAALLAGGIVSLATREGSRGGDIAMAVLYGVGGVVGLVLAGSYTDLRIWAVWSLLCMVVAMVDIGIHELSGEQEAPAPVQAAPAAKPSYATLEDVMTEPDPRRRSAAIDALPERAAKNYLKQVLNTFLNPDREDEETAGLVRTLIVVLAIVGLALVVVVAIGIFGALGFGPGAPASQPPAVTQSAQHSEAVSDTPEPSQESQTVSHPIPGSGNLGDYYVEIQNAFLTEDYQGNPAVVVTYLWTNNSQETTNAMTQLVEQTFQNGVELSMATITSSTQYESGTSLRDVRPGAQAEVQCAFRLSNTTSPIEFEVSEFLGRSSTVVYASFDLTTLDAEV